MANKMTVAHIQVNTVSIDTNGKDIQKILSKYDLIIAGALEGITKAIRADDELNKIIKEVMIGKRLKKLEVIDY